ncbi:hypothetical protein BI081_gp157 [Mycobacterium phage Tonenili]|uniref:Uncharacterized protein n=1 Tax=Mycobacterium phage Tonenili TaxID=1891703 RepID=A0A1C9EHI3_9CAUD|nr:hypothetical protein BI081_gp157 [Mycobacterium phage Tonenili]AON96950.1 hypothetical protein SEA_TONENILI_230 [Mycobacterium phage Tonenili]
MGMAPGVRWVLDIHERASSTFHTTHSPIEEIAIEQR